MIKNILAACVFLLSVKAFGQLDRQKVHQILNQSIELYNQQNYQESVKALTRISNVRSQYLNWYYYYGLNQMQLQNYDNAARSLEIFIKRSPAQNTARAYYYLGRIQFQKGEYEKAIASLELSLDVSTDPKLDNMSEELLDKAIRYQYYYENSDRGNLTFLLGYSYDDNVLNLSKSLFPEKINGHVLNYGAALSYKVIDQYSFNLDPTLAVLDNYTFNESFQTNSTVQGADALQILASVPVRFTFGEGLLAKNFDISLNYYTVYLPMNGSKRELASASTFLRFQALTPWSSKFAMRYNAIVASDKASGFQLADDDASGTRLEVMLSPVQYLSDMNHYLMYDLGYEQNTATGINARYKRYQAAINFGYASFGSSNSTLRLAYSNLSYPDKNIPRKDNQYSLSHTTSMPLGWSNSSLGITVGVTNNQSNIDFNKYTDFNAGLLFAKSFGF